MEASSKEVFDTVTRIVEEVAEDVYKRQGLRPAPDGADGQADRALARFGLEDIAERHPLSLSGGQRQRLAIAVGILQGARVLVLDEPTSGLDFGTMGRVADEVRRARDAGARCV